MTSKQKINIFNCCYLICCQQNMILMTRKTKVLSIEPAEDARSSLSKILVGPNTEFTLEFVPSIKELIEKKQETDYDIILTEILIPKYKGIEALKEVKHLFPNLPVIVVTDKQSERMASTALDNGAEDYLLKNTLCLKRLPRVIKFALDKKKFIDSETRYKEKLIKTNRFYNFISQINHLIIKAKEKEHLVQEACNIAIRYGHFQMAWIGLADKDSGLIKPYCWAGNEQGYLSDITIKISNDSPESLGPTASALRKGSPITCNDIENDPMFKPWREEALKRGFYSSIGLPIMTDNEVFGIFNLYSDEAFFFDENEIKSLEEVVSDISYAIINIETNEKLKRAEQELRLWQKELLDYFEHDISADFFVDDKGNLISCNSAFYKLFEVKSDPTRSLNVIDFYKNKEERNKIISLIKEFKKLENYEMEMISKNGKELHLIGNILGNFDDSGKLISIKKYLVDITQRKMAEELLGKLSKAVDQSPVSIVITNKDAKIEYVNPKFTEITGYTMEEALGKNPNIISIHSKTRKEYKDLWDTLLSGSTWAGEFLNKKKSGELFWEHAIISPIMNKNGEISHFVAISEDITEKKAKDHELVEALKKAQESDRLKSAFLANMSHEIRTPMNGILGFAELLKEPMLDGDLQQEYLGIIEKSAKRMLDIITDIVSISKIEAGMTKLQFTEVNVNQELEFAYNSLIHHAQQKGLKFNYKKQLPDKDVLILTDKDKLYSIITNLLKNAIKFTNSGSVSIEYKRKGENLIFCIKDTGIGISQDIKNRVFERFRQGNETLTRIHEGAGLGLAISKAFVEMLQGEIWFKSEPDPNNPSHGTSFYFSIPYSPVGQNEILEEEYSQGWEDLQKLNILIAEDDEISKTFLNKLLKPVALNIYNASSGEEAVQICRQVSGIDLVLMDIKMHGMNGYDATRKIRKFNKDVLIIAQTAFAMEGDREKALEAGCNEYITKPIQISKLNSLLREFNLQ